MNDKTLEILTGCSQYELGEIYCKLNTWKIPKLLQNNEVIFFNDFKDGWNIGDEEKQKRYSEFCRPIMAWITNRIGEKQVSRHWNTIHRQDPGKMSDAEHERWWKNRHKGLGFDHKKEPSWFSKVFEKIGL